MIDMSATAAELVKGSYTTFVSVESWLGDQLLTDDIPVIGATEEGDRSLRVPERMTLSVPREAGGVSWVPVTPDAPLGAYGQQLRVSLGVGLSNGDVEWLNRGWFVVNSSSLDGDVVTVECLGLLALVDEATLITEYQPGAGATMGTVLRDLLEPGVTVNLDAAPASMSVASVASWSDNRLDAVLSVLDAWGADGAVDESGTFSVVDAGAAHSVVGSVDDGADGVALSWAGSSSRDGAFNYVVVKGTYPDTAGAQAGAEIIATAYDLTEGSPFKYGGDFSPYPVPYTYASPLLTTKQQCQKAARTILARLKRTASKRIDCTIIPNPAVQLGDYLSVTSSRLGLTDQTCSVEALKLPYTPGDPMSLTLRTV